MKLKELKLNALSTKKLNNRQMNYIKGGSGSCSCSCSCYYADFGGSSSSANAGANDSANRADGLHSPNNQYELDEIIVYP